MDPNDSQPNNNSTEIPLAEESRFQWLKAWAAIFPATHGLAAGAFVTKEQLEVTIQHWKDMGEMEEELVWAEALTFKHYWNLHPVQTFLDAGPINIPRSSTSVRRQTSTLPPPNPTQTITPNPTIPPATAITPTPPIAQPTSAPGDQRVQEESRPRKTKAPSASTSRSQLSNDTPTARVKSENTSPPELFPGLHTPHGLDWRGAPLYSAVLQQDNAWPFICGRHGEFYREVDECHPGLRVHVDRRTSPSKLSVIYVTSNDKSEEGKRALEAFDRGLKRYQYQDGNLPYFHHYHKSHKDLFLPDNHYDRDISRAAFHSRQKKGPGGKQGSQPAETLDEMIGRRGRDHRDSSRSRGHRRRSRSPETSR